MSKSSVSVRTGRRYRPNRLNGPYDAIIIGSGIGGLTTAACLAKMGKKICVLEQHYTAGGFTHAYERNGYEWDVGVHYLGEMGNPHSISRKIFDHISDGSLQWASMGTEVDRLHLGDKTFEIVSGRKAYRDKLVEYFPEEKDAIDKYMTYLQQSNAAIRKLAIDKILPRTASSILSKLAPGEPPEYANFKTREVLESLTKNQQLIAVMAGQWGDNGLPPAESSFIIHSMIAQHYMRGGFYPIGGASQIARSIIPVIQSSDGEVFTYASVKNILTDKGITRGVVMEDGTEIPCNTVISNAGVFNTFNKLIDDVTLAQPYHEKTTQVERSAASACLYIGLQKSAQELRLPKTNFWIYPSENYEADMAAYHKDNSADLPLAYISFPSAKDPSFADRVPGKATIEIVALETPGMFDQWKDTEWGKRGKDYEAIKEAFSQRLLKKLYEKMPHLEGQIDYYELSTSLSTAHFCGYEAGEIYGLNHNPQRFEQDWLKPQTDIPGLYLTGQDVMTCGVVGAMMGGLLTAVKLGGLKGLGLAKAMLL